MNHTEKTVKTRIAPSPTGEYHVGSLRTALYNYAFAKSKGGKFLVRVEDTDRSRYVEGSDLRMLEVMKKFGLHWDEGPQVGGSAGPYYQSERLETYQKHIRTLLESKNAYYCFCSKERLDALREEQQAKGVPSTRYDRECLKLSEEEVAEKLKTREPYVIRMRCPDNQEITFEDLVVGRVSFNSKDIDDQVLIKSDGFPTYHFAVVVDDYLMGVTHVIRGREWLPSTPKQLLLYQFFGWQAPHFAHLPNLKEVSSTKKMSKRFGDVAALDFLSQGYFTEALLNFIMFLGWNPGDDREVFSLTEFVSEFSIERITKSELVSFDRERLSWLNGLYIRNLSPQELYTRLKDWSLEFSKSLDYLLNEEFAISVIKLVQDRMRTLGDFAELSPYFYNQPKFDENAHKKMAELSGDKWGEFAKALELLFSSLDTTRWTSEELDNKLHGLVSSNQWSTKELFMSLRYALTGFTTTPPLGDVIALLGKSETTQRIKHFYS